MVFETYKFWCYFHLYMKSVIYLDVSTWVRRNQKKQYLMLEKLSVYYHCGLFHRYVIQIEIPVWQSQVKKRPNILFLFFLQSVGCHLSTKFQKILSQNISFCSTSNHLYFNDICIRSRWFDLLFISQKYHSENW